MDQHVWGETPSEAHNIIGLLHGVHPVTYNVVEAQRFYISNGLKNLHDTHLGLCMENPAP